MYNILICDDERDIVSALEIYLSSENYTIYKAYTGLEALRGHQIIIPAPLTAFSEEELSSAFVLAQL